MLFSLEINSQGPQHVACFLTDGRAQLCLSWHRRVLFNFLPFVFLSPPLLNIVNAIAISYNAQFVPSEDFSYLQTQFKSASIQKLKFLSRQMIVVICVILADGFL